MKVEFTANVEQHLNGKGMFFTKDVKVELSKPVGGAINLPLESTGGVNIW
jgi:hypothetical protein